MSTDPYIRIIEELHRRTRARLIEWQQTNIRNQYTISLGEGTVVVDYNDAPLVDEPIYSIEFRNKRGEPIHGINIMSEEDKEYPLIDALWNEMEDAYYRRNETLSSMLSDLGLPS